DEVTVDMMSISPERRATYFGRQQGNTKQGAHLVAWSAMVRFWNRQLTGRLSTALERLESWILGDELVDTAQGVENQALRGRALWLTRRLRAERHTLDAILDQFEEAVSLFVEANQMSSFTTQGESHG